MVEASRYYALGVTVREGTTAHVYEGDAASLAKCGLLCLDHCPGQPGMGKTTVTVYADGATAKRGEPRKAGKSMKPGARRIDRLSADRFRVTVRVCKDARSDANTDELLCDPEQLQRCREGLHWLVTHFFTELERLAFRPGYGPRVSHQAGDKFQGIRTDLLRLFETAPIVRTPQAPEAAPRLRLVR